MAKLFTNYTNEDFTHSWDGKFQTFPAGKTVPMSDDVLAEHFAKHFINREIIRDRKEDQLLDETVRASYHEKCIKNVVLPSMPGMSDEARMFEALKEQAKAEALAELKEEKQEEPKVARKPRAKKEEVKAVEDESEEFADLKA